jgi:hypothetical protein
VERRLSGDESRLCESLGRKVLRRTGKWLQYCLDAIEQGAEIAKLTVSPS